MNTTEEKRDIRKELELLEAELASLKNLMREDTKAYIARMQYYESERIPWIEQRIVEVKINL